MEGADAVALQDSTIAAARGGSDVDVSVLLVSYNSAAVLEECLRRLDDALTGIASEVLVLDNASRDDSIGVVRRARPATRVVENAANVGFGRAINQLAQLAAGRYLLLLNTDAFVPADGIAKTLAFMDDHATCGVLGVRLVGVDGHLQPSCRWFPTPSNVFLSRTGLNRFLPNVRLVDDMGWDHASVRSCDWVPGCFYLVRRAVVDAVGLFDPRYFLYYEEVDHCRAVKAAGWDVVYCPVTTVVHVGGVSARSDADLTAHGRQISRLQCESEFLYFRKHHGVLGAWSLLLSNWLADALTLVRGMGRPSWRERLSRAADNTRLCASVFFATRGGRHATR